MLTKKKKLSRKEIKEDKLVSAYYKAYGYFDENRSKIILYGGVLAALIIAVFFYISNKNANNEKAAVALGKVMSIYDQGSYLEAIEGRPSEQIIGLRSIVENYGSTENGETAKIYLANSYQMLGKYDEAFKYYEDYDGGIPIFKSASLAGQAGYYASKNEYEKAAGLFRDAAHISKVNVFNSEYLLKAGINFLNAGKSEEAKELFEKIKKDYPAAQSSREADKYLAQVSAN